MKNRERIVATNNWQLTACQKPRAKSQELIASSQKPILLLIALLISVQCYAQLNIVSSTGITNLYNSSIAWGDMDNDGLKDILIAGENALNDYQCKFYQNNGDDTFDDIGISMLSLLDGDIALIDFNGDNYLDIAICGKDQSNDKYSKIYKNNQNRSFTEISTTLQGLFLGSLDWADYDNDGDYDLLICGQDASNVRKTLIYENTGSETFTEITPSIPGISQGKAIWGDMNNDGYVDIAISGLDNSSNYITEIYVNNGDKTFSSHNANLQKLAYSEIEWVDYDNDGDLDFWISGSDIGGTNYIRLYKNNPGNTFASVVAGFTVLDFISASWGDYDADGDADLVYMGRNSSTPTVYYYRNDGSDVFTAVDLSLTALAEGDIAWADYTNDNKLDLLMSGSSSGGGECILYQNAHASNNTAPNVITGLSVNSNEDEVTLSWNAGTDTETPNGLSYRLSIGNASGDYNIMSSMANGGTGASYLVETGLLKATSVTIKNLPEGQYYWTVQAVDPSFQASAFATETTFAICNPISIGADQEVCLQNNLICSAGSGSDVVNWDSEISGLIASATQNLSYTINQNEQIRVEVNKAIGCTVRDTIEVTALSLPTVSLPASETLCFGDTLKLEAGNDDQTINWFAESGDNIGIGKQLAYKIGNSETIKCEITGTNACLDSAKVNIISLALPQASLGNDYSECVNTNIQLQINGMQSVNWYDLSGTEIALAVDQIAFELQTDTIIVGQFYNTDNCVNYDTLNIAVTQLSLVNAGNDTTICFNTSILLGGSPTTNGGLEPYIYTWRDENDQVFSSDANPELNPTENTFYKLHVSDQNGCEGSDLIQVKVNPASIINAGADASICNEKSVELGANPTAENSLFNYTYRWWPEKGLNDHLSANPMASPSDTTTYRLIVSTYFCDPDTAFVSINVNPLPEVSITEDHNIGYGETTIIEASGGETYEWAPVEGLESPEYYQTEASPEATTIYVVTATNANGCQKQAAVKISVLNDLFIPNLFTPNGDGNNDFFRVYGSGIEELRLIIYNSNGNIVFQSSDIQNLIEIGWDGTTNGTKQTQGSYLWAISGRFKDGTIIKYKNNRGTINLMR